MDQYCCNNCCDMQCQPAAACGVMLPPTCIFTDYKPTRLEPRPKAAWERGSPGRLRTGKRCSVKPKRKPSPVAAVPKASTAKTTPSVGKPKLSSHEILNCCCEETNTTANPSGKAPEELPESCDKTNCPAYAPEAERNDNAGAGGKKFEETCADFLNIVHDTVKETVQKSIECVLKDYFVHTTEKMECLSTQMMRNECLLSKMYLDMLDRFGDQTDKTQQGFSTVCNCLSAQSKREERIFAGSTQDNGPYNRGREPYKTTSTTQHIAQSIHGANEINLNERESSNVTPQPKKNYYYTNETQEMYAMQEAKPNLFYGQSNPRRPFSEYGGYPFASPSPQQNQSPTNFRLPPVPNELLMNAQYQITRMLPAHLPSMPNSLNQTAAMSPTTASQPQSEPDCDALCNCKFLFK